MSTLITYLRREAAQQSIGLFSAPARTSDRPSVLGWLTQFAAFTVRAHGRRDAHALRFAREVIWDSAARLRRYRTAGPLTLPTVSLERLVGNQELTLHVGDCTTEDGGVSPFDALCLAALTQHIQPRRVFEIGTFQGRTAALLARFAPPDAQIFTLDLPASAIAGLAARPNDADLHLLQKPAIGARIHGSGAEHKVTQLLGDSTRYDYSPYVGNCDLVFVDAAHTYEFVTQDTHTAFRLIRPGGLVVWHDYRESCTGVVRALHEAARHFELQHIAHTSLVVYGLTSRT